ncbi:MAG: SUMF1/EgtB/PvdO family nonheme iron enzyme [Rhodospirillales bacterium]|nr:SUMF1/EgtB/PvdO family nonheme iron enzyme [Rhodospirillales bacterium]
MFRALKFLMALACLPLLLEPVQAQDLPPQITFDLKVQELSDHIKNERWTDAISTVEDIKTLDLPMPPSLSFFEAKANLNADRPNAAEQAFLDYVKKTGKSGKYYTEALSGIVAARQSDRYLTVKEGEFFDCAECPVMVELSPGRYRMGDVPGKNVHGYETKFDHPVIVVQIPYRFAIGKYEVTRGQFRSFTEETDYRVGRCSKVYTVDSKGALTGKGYHNHWRRAYGKYAKEQNTWPITCINWDDAKAYAAWLSQKTGHEYRLPTETEWEYAARAGTDTVWPCGNDDSCVAAISRTKAVSRRNATPGMHLKPEPVGSKKPNAWGIHDMPGSVWEWTLDCFKGRLDLLPTDGRAATGDRGCHRTLRGGAFVYDPIGMRTSRRDSAKATHSDSLTGFRVVRVLR